MKQASKSIFTTFFLRNNSKFLSITISIFRERLFKNNQVDDQLINITTETDETMNADSNQLLMQQDRMLLGKLRLYYFDLIFKVSLHLDNDFIKN